MLVSRLSIQSSVCLEVIGVGTLRAYNSINLSLVNNTEKPFEILPQLEFRSFELSDSIFSLLPFDLFKAICFLNNSVFFYQFLLTLRYLERKDNISVMQGFHTRLSNPVFQSVPFSSGDFSTYQVTYCSLFTGGFS